MTSRMQFFIVAQKTLFHSTFSYCTTENFPRASNRFSDWMESRLAWKMNQIKFNKHFELGNYWLSAVAVESIVCRSQINRRWMKSTKNENKPRSVINSSIQRCFFALSFPAVCDLWTHFLRRAMMMWKKFIICRKSKRKESNENAENAIQLTSKVFFPSKVFEIAFNHVRRQKSKMANFSVTINVNNESEWYFWVRPRSDLDSQTNLFTLGMEWEATKPSEN